MASFNSHSKCARCHDKGVGEDDCILKKDCAVCKEFTPEQITQLATPTYKERKSREKKVVASSLAPTLVDPAHVSVLGKVEGGKAVKPETTPSKKSKRSKSPKTASKKRSISSSKPSAEDLQKLDDKWAERFSRLEAMLLAKTFTVVWLHGVPVPALFRPPVAVDVMEMATQPLEAPGAGTATQPVQAPGSVSDVQPSGEGDLSTASDSEGDQQSVTGSLSEENYQYGSPDRDLLREEATDQELSEEASYRETM